MSRLSVEGGVHAFSNITRLVLPFSSLNIRIILL